MFGVMKKLLMARQIKFEEGRIVLFGQRIFMIPTYSYITLQLKLEESGLAHLIYHSTKDLGKQWTLDLQKNYKTNHKYVVDWGINIVNLAGYGVAETVKDDPENNHSAFRLKDSATAEYVLKALKKKSEYPVCHLFRGMITGTFSVLYKTDLDGIETKCKAMGYPHCEFILKPKKEFDLTDKQIKRQLG
ncbi:MAG: 4-vinyl reductase [Candidatus Aenigmatarchaeota archaeon]